MNGAQHDGAWDGYAAAAKSGSRTAGDYRDFVGRSPSEHCGDLLSGARKNDGVGGAMERGCSVEAVGVEVLGGGEDVGFRQDCDERFETFGREGHVRTDCGGG